MRLELGHTSNVSGFRGIGEHKIDWVSGYRFCLAKEGDTLIVRFGGSTQKNPQKAIEQAAKHDEYTAKKNALAAERTGKKAWR
ncbi:MAG: hypothetical protein Q8M78_15120 [Burkholderiaceae bacterium]|nr:hypothetical protein [Burkholderiaceae bacterium]